MKRRIKFIRSVFFVASVMLVFSFSGFAQEGGSPQPPPVDIVITTTSTPQVGQEVTLVIKVTPQADMHADISCLLPQGIELVGEEDFMVHPYAARLWPGNEEPRRYLNALEMWVGPLTGGVTKEFSFKIIIPDNQRYELIAQLEALAKWGAKKQVFVIDID